MKSNSKESPTTMKDNHASSSASSAVGSKRERIVLSDQDQSDVEETKNAENEEGRATKKAKLNTATLFNADARPTRPIDKGEIFISVGDEFLKNFHEGENAFTRHDVGNLVRIAAKAILESIEKKHHVQFFDYMQSHPHLSILDKYPKDHDAIMYAMYLLSLSASLGNEHAGWKLSHFLKNTGVESIPIEHYGKDPKSDLEKFLKDLNLSLYRLFPKDNHVYATMLTFMGNNIYHTKRHRDVETAKSQAHAFMKVAAELGSSEAAAWCQQHFPPSSNTLTR